LNHVKLLETEEEAMKMLLTALLLGLVVTVFTPSDRALAGKNPYKHWGKHQEKLWKEQSKQERKWLKAQRKHAKEMRKLQEKLWKEQSKQERRWLKAQQKYGKEMYKLHRERARTIPWFDDTAPQFGDTWHADPYHVLPPAPQLHQDVYPPPPPSPYEYELIPQGYPPGPGW
jgi:hypothetical protein